MQLKLQGWAQRQVARLLDPLRGGPEAYGFWGEHWTRGWIAAVICLGCGASYHPVPVGQLCQAIH